MHLLDQFFHLRAQRLCQADAFPPSTLAVIQRALRDITAEHILQAHGLRAELQGVAVIFLGSSALVLHGIGHPKPFPSRKRDPFLPPMILQDIALSGNSKLRRIDADAALDQQISPTFLKFPVVGFFVQ